MLRLSRITSFVPIAAPLLVYLERSASMSSDPALLERDTMAVLDKFFSLPVADPYRPLRHRIYSNHWMILSGSYLHHRRLGAAVRCLARGLVSHPANASRPLGLPVRRMRRARAAPELER
jgi:hypothetical protein